MGERMSNSIYATNTFCSTCHERRPLGIIHCPECGRKVRTHRMTSRKKQQQQKARPEAG
jgi:predicted amidophosphoribosyltransferase